jgi:putative membrane protein
MLNGISAVLLVLGWTALRGRGLFAARGPDEGLHKRLMLSAVGVSAAFLASYLHYHHRVGSVPFWGSGWVRSVYLAVLVPHIILAAVMVPMIGLVLWHALAGRLDRHRRLARWTLPIWLYVSVTGVVVYVMLYRLGPDAG